MTAPADSEESFGAIRFVKAVKRRNFIDSRTGQVMYKGPLNLRDAECFQLDNGPLGEASL